MIPNRLRNENWEKEMPVDECPELRKELERFLDDPITIAYGVGGEMTPLLVRKHVERHHCRGLGDDR